MVAKYQSQAGNGPVPAWILPPLSCEFLSAVAGLWPAPVQAFEFGSGRSTGVLREVSAQATSIESSAEWLNRTEETTTKRAADHARVISVRRCWNRLRPIESFDLEAHPDILVRLKESRLILVDGPPNPAKREHALFLALRYSPIGAVIIVDDLEVRAVSRFATRLARQNTRLFGFWNLPIDHQLAVFLKVRSGRIRSWPSARDFVGTWLRA